jgi:adenosylcobinamide-GDP ribazoletransferase
VTTDPPSGVARRLGAALLGALGFLTRVPVGTDAGGWASFRRTPAAFVPVGYLLGAVLALVFAVDLPSTSAAVLFPVAVVAATGINHADGLADLGDAAAVHGDRRDRRRVRKDESLGVGGTMALLLLVVGLATAAVGVADMPLRQAVAVVVAAEVSAKLGMAAIACLGTASTQGLGAQLTTASTRTDLLVPFGLAVPVAVLGWPTITAAVALAAGTGSALCTWRFARSRFGGVNGDVFGAANELARVVALHAGVVAWTLW